MSSALAQKVFRTPAARNCAQAIYRGFQDTHNVSENCIEQASAFGGGRAAEGTCGALYAALDLASAEAREDMKRKFAAVAGDFRCKPIRKLDQLDCPGCVALAGDLLEEIS